jgi:hypothetical protein
VNNPIRNKSRRSIFNASLPGGPNMNETFAKRDGITTQKKCVAGQSETLAGNTSVLFVAAFYW